MMEGSQDYVNFNITNSNNEDTTPVERRFKKDITVLEFKKKLELVTGGSAATMKLKLFDSKNKFVCDIDNDNTLLNSYSIDDGMRVHVIDNFTLVKDFAATDSDERFQLSEEDYEKKGDTLRSYLQQNKLGKYNEEEMNKSKEQLQQELEEEAKRKCFRLDITYWWYLKSSSCSHGVSVWSFYCSGFTNTTFVLPLSNIVQKIS